MTTDSLVGRRWEVMHKALNERQRRLLVAVECVFHAIMTTDFRGVTGHFKNIVTGDFSNSVTGFG